MAQQFYTLLTNIGKAKLANANVFGKKINLTTLVVGDGNGNYYNPTEDQEKLVSEVWRGNIQLITVDEQNPNWIKIETVIPSNVGGFTIREVGGLDDEGNLILIAKYPETYKPIIDDGATKELRIKIILEVSNTENVTLKVNPNVITATKEDIENLKNKINNLDGKAVTLRSYSKLEKDTKIIPIDIPEFNPLNEDDLEVHMNGRLLTKDVNYKIASSNTDIENIDEEILWQTGDEFDIALHKNIKNKVEHIDVGLIPKGSITEDKLNPQIVEKVTKLGEDIKNIDLSADKVNLSGVTGITSDNVKGAIQELFQFANNGKQNWVDVIGSPLVNADTFSTLKSKTQSLKNTMASNLISKYVSASGTESLKSLIDKIPSITSLNYNTINLNYTNDIPNNTNTDVIVSTIPSGWNNILIVPNDISIYESDLNRNTISFNVSTTGRYIPEYITVKIGNINLKTNYSSNASLSLVFFTVIKTSNNTAVVRYLVHSSNTSSSDKLKYEEYTISPGSSMDIRISRYFQDDIDPYEKSVVKCNLKAKIYYN